MSTSKPTIPGRTPTTVTSSREGSTVTIRISGHFGFPAYRPFREAYVTNPAGTRYVVDLHGTEYMDSSALGMLLVLREHAGGERAAIRIEKARPEVRQILQTAHFDRLFTID